MSMLDILGAAIFFLVASIILAIAYLLSGSIFPQLSNTIGSNTVTPIATSVNGSLGILVDGALIVYIVINLSAIAAAFFVKQHPILAISGFLILGIIILIANILTDVFQTFISSSTFVGIGNTNLSIIVTLFKVLPIAVFIMGLMLMIFQYAKTQQQST